MTLRMARPGFLRHTRVDHPHVYSQTYGWSLRRGVRYEGRQGEAITVNRLGYRGREHTGAPAPGARRVVMLGDSVTFGTGVADGETFSDRLEEAGGFEVVNLGVDGYGTDQELIRLEEEGLSYRPHDVVLNFCVRNDYFDNALPVALYDGISPKPYFTLEDGQLVRHDAHLRIGAATRAAVALQERSHLVNALLLLAGRPPRMTGGGRDEADWGERR
ncbi:MAG TPA: SGNH/GDSL hydrolase family protein, partial [Vicinamibacteria bacterium]|nr:SGNH/GDSL hydrolase family protein [Vicinamibacteria bacterium]